MTAPAVVARLRAAGVEIAVDESGGIRCRARPGVLTDELRALIKECRDDLLAELRNLTPIVAPAVGALEPPRRPRPPRTFDVNDFDFSLAELPVDRDLFTPEPKERK